MMSFLGPTFYSLKKDNFLDQMITRAEKINLWVKKFFWVTKFKIPRVGWIYLMGINRMAYKIQGMQKPLRSQNPCILYNNQPISRHFAPKAVCRRLTWFDVMNNGQNAV